MNKQTKEQMNMERHQLQMQVLGAFLHKLMLEPQSGGVVRLTDNRPAEGVGREKHSRKKAQPGGSVCAGRNTA